MYRGRASSAPSLQGHPDTQDEARCSVGNRLAVEQRIVAGGIAHRANPDATSEAPEIKPYYSRAVEARDSIHQSKAIARTQIHKGLDRAMDGEVSTQMPIDGDHQICRLSHIAQDARTETQEESTAKASPVAHERPYMLALRWPEKVPRIKMPVEIRCKRLFIEGSSPRGVLDTL